MTLPDRGKEKVGGGGGIGVGWMKGYVGFDVLRVFLIRRFGPYIKHAFHQET